MPLCRAYLVPETRDKVELTLPGSFRPAVLRISLVLTTPSAFKGMGGVCAPFAATRAYRRFIPSLVGWEKHGRFGTLPGQFSPPEAPTRSGGIDDEPPLLPFSSPRSFFCCWLFSLRRQVLPSWTFLSQSILFKNVRGWSSDHEPRRVFPFGD